MAEMLEIARRDSSFEQDIGHRDLVDMFDMLGGEHLLTARFRPLRVSALN